MIQRNKWTNATILKITPNFQNGTHINNYIVNLLYGVLRPSELIDVKITNTSDRYDDINYYNIWTNE